MKNPGIITGCNQAQEWLLPWWWKHFSSHHTLPVTFFDFGMSSSARLWCQKHGNLLSLPPLNLNPVPDSLQEKWKKIHLILPSRKSWFYKPFALAHCPYSHALWIDIDCQILKPLSTLLPSSFALAIEEPIATKLHKKIGLLKPHEILYNSGVIAFTQSNPLIEKWCQNTLKFNHLFLGDQDILSRTIFEENTPIETLPLSYNTPYFHCIPQGVPTDTHIIHYSSAAGKHLIYKNPKNPLDSYINL